MYDVTMVDDDKVTEDAYTMTDRLEHVAMVG